MPSTSNWQKSSFSGTGDDNNCVELAASAHSPRAQLHLRESEDPAVVLTTGPAPLHSLLKAVKRGLGQQA